MALPDGLYDQLLTEGLARALAGVGADRAEVAALDGAAGEVLADAVARQLAAILDDLDGTHKYVSHGLDEPTVRNHRTDDDRIGSVQLQK